MPTEIKLELEKVLQSEVDEMINARQKAIVIHHTRDIDASGDEVEKTVRNVISRKIPTSYYVGHGHAVDSKLTTSPQFDVVISDNNKAPILFSTQNGTEYFTYESIYAVGEIKSTYYKSKNYLEDFIKTLAFLRSNLERENVPPTYLGMGLNIGGGFTTDLKAPYRNPLFSFMLFVDATEFSVEQIAEIYNTHKPSELPNVLCLLNKGIVLNAKINEIGDGNASLGSINSHPEFDVKDENLDHWVFIPFGTQENRSAINWGVLYFMVIKHLQSSVLKSPDILKYLNRLFTYGDGILIT